MNASSYKKFAALFAVAIAAAGSASASTNLVVNGSFEQNSISSSWAPVSAVNGWSSSASGNSAFEIQKGATQGGEGGFISKAADGIQYLELNTDRLTSISQNVSTGSNGLYSLTFSYAGRPDANAAYNSEMNVYWNNALLNTSGALVATNGVWTTYTYNNLAATSALTSLKFSSIGPVQQSTYGSYLDNVSITAAVPEPSTYGMMLLGLGLVGFMARRKKA